MKTIDLVATTDGLMTFVSTELACMSDAERFKSRVYLSVRLQRMFGIPTLLRDGVKYANQIERYGEQIDALREEKWD